MRAGRSRGEPSPAECLTGGARQAQGTRTGLPGGQQSPLGGHPYCSRLWDRRTQTKTAGGGGARMQSRGRGHVNAGQPLAAALGGGRSLQDTRHVSVTQKGLAWEQELHRVKQS